mgnify:CR=1 FL=1
MPANKMKLESRNKNKISKNWLSEIKYQAGRMTQKGMPYLHGGPHLNHKVI